MTSQISTFQQKLREDHGFISIEMIMTIIIIAVILTSVMIGAHSMMEKNRQNVAHSQIMNIVQKFRSLHYAQSTAGTNDLTSTCIKAGVFNQDMVAGEQAVNPWDGAVTLTGDGTSFVLTYDKVPQKSCIDLITKHANSTDDLGLQSLVVGGTSIQSFPLSPEAATQACATTNTIKWKLRMRG